MLKEQTCKQPPGEPLRRWMADDYFDLIVWSGTDGGIFGFQLCYDKPHPERALTWTREGGYSHRCVDDGESSPFANCTPILVAVGHFPAEKVRRQFLWRSAEIDPQVRELVLEKIEEYAASCEAGAPVQNRSSST